MFSQPCRWRAPVLAALDRADRRWQIIFESTSLTGIQAAVRAGLGVAALLPVSIEIGMTAIDDTSVLPAMPDVELGLVRSSSTDGDPLVNAVEAVLRNVA
jgi:DNA-binding transcriptional LysR family regulator